MRGMLGRVGVGAEGGCFWSKEKERGRSRAYELGNKSPTKRHRGEKKGGFIE